MRKILFVPIIVALGMFAVPGMYYNGYIPVGVHSAGLSPLMLEDELYSKSSLILEGTLIDKTTELSFVKNGEIDTPYVFTTWTLLTKDTIKGVQSEKVEFKTSRGTYKNIEHVNLESLHMELDQDVIVFLSKDPPGSQWGDSYYLTGINSGLFKIDSEGNAKNDLRDVTVKVDELKTQLRSFER